MPHYTLLSGKPTDTITFKCDGCMRRFPALSRLENGAYRYIAYPRSTAHHWNVVVCSDACLALADQRYTTMLIDGSHNALVREAIEIGSNGHYTFTELLTYIRG